MKVGSRKQGSREAELAMGLGPSIQDAGTGKLGREIDVLGHLFLLLLLESCDSHASILWCGCQSRQNQITLFVAVCAC